MGIQMNLKYFEVFLKVYERENMSVAAEELFLSQPAVSRIISELETAYQSRFFLRQSGRLYRTEGGKQFYIYAKQLVEAAEQLDCAMQRQKRNMKVCIGATPTAVSYYLPQILRDYQETCGELDLRLYAYPPNVLLEMVRTAQLDFAVVEGVVPSQEIEMQPLPNDKLVFVSAGAPEEDFPLPLLVRDVGDWEQQRLEHALFEWGVRYEICGRFADVESIKRCASAGLGVGLVPSRSVEPGDALVRLDLPTPPLDTAFSIAYYRKKFLFPQLRSLLGFVEQEFQLLLSENEG